MLKIARNTKKSIEQKEFWSPPIWVDQKSSAFKKARRGAFLYYHLNEEVYWREDGTSTMLSRWLGRCASCGKPYAFLAPSHLRSARRRCDNCKRRGLKAVPYTGGKPRKASHANRSNTNSRGALSILAAEMFE